MRLQLDAITGDPENLRKMGKAARERVLDAHTAEHRGRELVELLEAAA